MKKRYSLVVIMILLSLLLGGCSLMTDQSTEKQEMIQIAESQKMKVAIENMLTKLDSKALTPEGKIKSYKISKDDLKDYNPMGGILVKIVINNDEKLVLSTTIQEDATTKKYEETYFGETEELSDLLTSNHSGKHP